MVIIVVLVDPRSQLRAVQLRVNEQHPDASC